MSIDDRRLDELIVESKDLQADAMRGSASRLADVGDFAHDAGDRRPDPEQLARFNEGRAETGRRVFAEMGTGTKLLAGGLIGGALATILGRPASADEALDVQILQTASSLERLAISTYSAALALPFIAEGNATVIAFAETTRMQHDEHRAAFQAMTETLGGPIQDFANPVFQQVVNEAVPTLTGPLEVVVLAAAVEKVATDTYLKNLQLLEDTATMSLFGSVMGVESQHLAVLRAVQALLEAELPDLIAIPTDLAALPAAAGSASFPEPFETIDETMIAQPESGAVQ
jgi:rubrerythrin